MIMHWVYIIYFFRPAADDGGKLKKIKKPKYNLTLNRKKTYAARYQYLKGIF